MLNALWYLLPALSFATLALGLWWRGRSPLWLPLVATLVPVGLIVLALDARSVDPAGWADNAPSLLPTFLIVLGLLLVAAVFVGRHWRARGAVLVAGLGITAAIGALMLAVQLAAS